MAFSQLIVENSKLAQRFVQLVSMLWGNN